MKDREFLMWMHERLHLIHGESETISHLHKLRVIIRATPEDQQTPNVDSKNSLQEMEATF